MYRQLIFDLSSLGTIFFSMFMNSKLIFSGGNVLPFTAYSQSGEHHIFMAAYLLVTSLVWLSLIVLKLRRSREFLSLSK